MPLYRATKNGRVEISQSEEAEILADAFEGAKKSKIEELQAAYVSDVYADIVHDSKTWKADVQSRELLAQTLSVGSVPAGMYWRDSSEVQHSMTFSQLQALALAILERGLAADANVVAKIAAVNVAADQAAIDLIVY